MERILVHQPDFRRSTMLLDAIRGLFTPAPPGTDARADRGSPGGTPTSPDPLVLAACVLLLDVAYADGEFSRDERGHLEDVLARHFGLPADAGAQLLELAEQERRKAVDHYRFTSELQREYDLDQKMALAEAMWGIVLADGAIAEHEHYLTRKIANLLGLAPAYLSAARNAAAEKLGSGE